MSLTISKQLLCLVADLSPQEIRKKCGTESIAGQIQREKLTNLSKIGNDQRANRKQLGNNRFK